ncbi:nitrogen regulation protein NR(II) [Halomicroarcula sp. GCM10025324]|uniref:two-component system sensor histidine kinase NtrB n=1 Tax=Haloarcula TaxID=2237 RepID=UPI0023E8C58A|nr:PAS domain S-box protein [Halomicroarcula sp. ZS-22-S1]
MVSHSPLAIGDDFYQTLVENAAEGMLTIDEQSTIVYANPAIQDILGYSPDELIGSSKMEIIPDRLEPVHAAALESYVETGERNIDWNGIELPALHKDGHEVPTLISLREHEHNGERYFTGIIRDITERRRREEQLQDQKERLNEFADILTHDIRNPLSVARGYTAIAQDDHEIPELEKISESLMRIDNLVDDVLELSKEGRSIGDTEPIELEGCLRESWNNVETYRATLRIEDELGSITADKSRFQELLENLFRNAIDHGGEDVTVRVGRLDGKPGVYVADDGAGISKSIRSEVFTHGYSTNREGTGYGLSIVHQIVEGHGWEIEITESSEGGARFEIAW